MNYIEFIAKISSVDLSKVSYGRLLSTITNSNFQIPFTTTLVKKGALIERGRITNEGEEFTSEKEITFRTDLENIRKFGRANLPHSSMFYGSIGTTEIKEARVAVFTELCPEFRQEPVQDVDKVITIGKWEVINEFEVADIVFSENYSTNSRANETKGKWLKHISEKSGVKSDEHITWLKFFSEQFAKTDIKNDHEYMLSCIYTNLAIQFKNINGVIYPSVRTDYNIDNIVLPPRIVEENLKLQKVGKFRLFAKDGKGTLDCISTTDNLGFLNSEFKWN